MRWLENILERIRPYGRRSSATAKATAATVPVRPDLVSSQPIFTNVPGHEPIELVSYYKIFSQYYPNCELQTKRWFVENAAPEWIIFDVGANIGYYSILFSRLAAKGMIYAFEPTGTADLLQQNLAHHRCANVKTMRLALGAASGKFEENIYRIWGQPPERQLYEFSMIDEVAEQLGLARLDCLKIDCDSFDFEVLRGARRTLERLNPWIVVELNHALALRNQSVPEALEWLLAQGYDCAHVLDYENYVLRRPAVAVARATIQLSFETRPIG
jgi:FkbM family methyltransferase